MKNSNTEAFSQSGSLFQVEHLNIDASKASSIQQIRPIHYLGSKLRILDFIKCTIDKVDPTGGGVCDLFAGSGTVSKHLSITRPVTSVDIQEYSRVLCSALLNPFTFTYQLNSFVNTCKSSDHFRKLRWSVEPIIEYEAFCNKNALLGNPIPLCELLESGSIIGFEQGYIPDCSADLIDVLKNTFSRLTKLNLLLGPEALVVRYFGGLYFSYLQAIQIDTLLEEISKLSKETKDTFLAATLSSASDIVNTVGKQFAQPIKPRNSDGTPKINIVNRIQKDRNHDVFLLFQKWLERYLSQDKSKFDHIVYKMDYVDALDIIPNNIKVVYADPPYTRYHYSRYYHVLETICLRDNPKISRTFIDGKTKLSRGIYREDRHQSSFCIKSQSAAAFDTLFKKVRDLNAALVLSYSPYDKTQISTPRVHLIDQLEKLAKQYYKNVDIISAGQFSHSKLNHSDKNFDVLNNNAESLIVCQIL